MSTADTFSSEVQAQMTVATTEAMKSPKVQEAVKKSIEEAGPVSVSAKVSETPAPTEQVAEPRKISKLEVKRMQIYTERRQRLINKGVPEDKVDQVIAEEDYAKLPLEEKFKRLQHAFSALVKGISGDIMAVRQNQSVLAETMEINFRAINKALAKAGVSNDDQKVILDEVQKELVEEMKQMAEAHKKQAAANAEKQAVGEVLESVNSKIDSGASEGAETPDEATVFGG